MKKILFLLFAFLFAFSIQGAAQVTKVFHGNIGDESQIEMSLTFDGDNISGTYFFVGPADTIRVYGKLKNDGTFWLELIDGEGKRGSQRFSGKWEKKSDSNQFILFGTFKDIEIGEEISFYAREIFLDVDEQIKFATQYYEDVNELKRFEIEARYPEITNNDSQAIKNFNQLVKTRVMDQINEFRKLMSENTAEDLKYLPEDVSNYIEIGYSVESASKRFVSVKFYRSEYTGGAHPNSWSFTLNYDLENSREIKLSDLFKPNSNYLKFISDQSIELLLNQQEESKDEDWIKSGASAETKNFESWNITKNGLKFTFDAYQIAPYVAGPSSIVLKFNKFPDDIKSSLFYPVSLVSYIDGSPANWCRGGRWTMQDQQFKLATVKGKKKERAYFYDDQNDCPDGENCRRKSYVITGDELIIKRTYGDFACAWYQPKKGYETVGWIKLDKLKIHDKTENDGDWTGNWIYGDNNIDIKAARSRGKYTIKGNAFWKGVGDNIHIGELDYEGMPEGDIMKVGDGDHKYDCRVKMTRLGKYLIVSDNLMCGGANVTFNGIYLKK